MSEHYYGQGPTDHTARVVGGYTLAQMRAGKSDSRIELQAEIDRERVQLLVVSESEWDKERISHTNEVFAATSRDIPEVFAETGNVRENFVEWLALTDTTLFVDFLKWNEASLRELQTKLRHRARHMEAFLLSDVAKLTPWFIPSTAPELFEKMMDSPSYLHLEDAYQAGSSAAEYYYRRMQIAVSEGFIEDNLLYDLLMHEFFHAASHQAGGNLTDLYGSHDSDVRTTWFNEAVTEHLTHAAIYGDHLVISPDERQYQPNPDAPDHVKELYAYMSEVRLLNYLLHKGKRQVSVIDVAGAYFEPKTTPQLRSRVLQEIEDSFADMFPELSEGLFKTITREYNRAESPKTQEAVMEKWMKEIDRRNGMGITDLTHESAFRPQPDMELIPAS